MEFVVDINYKNAVISISLGRFWVTCPQAGPERTKVHWNRWSRRIDAQGDRT